MAMNKGGTAKSVLKPSRPFDSHDTWAILGREGFLF